MSHRKVLAVDPATIETVSMSDGLMRLVYGEDGDILPGAAKAHDLGGDVWRIVQAIVAIEPGLCSDDDGLYWTSRGSAERAVKVARRAVSA